MTYAPVVVEKSTNNVVEKTNKIKTPEIGVFLCKE